MSSTDGESGVASRFEGIVARSRGTWEPSGSTLSADAATGGSDASLLPSEVARMASTTRPRSMSPELSVTPLDGGGILRTLAGALELSGPVCWDIFARSRRLWRSRSRSLLSVMFETRAWMQRNSSFLDGMRPFASRAAQPARRTAILWRVPSKTSRADSSGDRRFASWHSRRKPVSSPAEPRPWPLPHHAFPPASSTPTI